MKNSPENRQTSPPENLLCLCENQSSERRPNSDNARAV